MKKETDKERSTRDYTRKLRESGTIAKDKLDQWDNLMTSTRVEDQEARSQMMNLACANNALLQVEWGKHKSADNKHLTSAIALGDMKKETDDASWSGLSMMPSESSGRESRHCRPMDQPANESGRKRADRFRIEDAHLPLCIHCGDETKRLCNGGCLMPYCSLGCEAAGLRFHAAHCGRPRF